MQLYVLETQLVDFSTARWQVNSCSGRGWQLLLNDLVWEMPSERTLLVGIGMMQVHWRRRKVGGFQMMKVIVMLVKVGQRGELGKIAVAVATNTADMILVVVVGIPRIHFELVTVAD